MRNDNINEPESSHAKHSAPLAPPKTPNENNGIPRPNRGAIASQGGYQNPSHSLNHSNKIVQGRHSAPLQQQSAAQAAPSINPDPHHRQNASAPISNSQQTNVRESRDLPKRPNHSKPLNEPIAEDRSATDPSALQGNGSVPGKERVQIREGAEGLLGKTEKERTVEPGIYPQQIEQRNIFKENPNVYYLNGESLSRPLTVPPDIKKKRWIFVAIAALIACLMLYFYFDQIVSAPARTQEQLLEMLSQDVATNPPDLLKMLSRTDKKIKSTLNSTAKKGGYSIIDLTDEKNEDISLRLVKIPPGLTSEEGSELYAEGLDNLNVLQLVSVLNGGWDLDVNRKTGLNIALHYADFQSSSPSTAIAQAIAAEGLSRGTTAESGDNDGYGNAYTSGSIMIKNVDYEWTVSSTYLKDVYSVSGIPEKATYVGIRLIRKAS